MLVKLTIRDIGKEFDIVLYKTVEETPNPNKASPEIKLVEELDTIANKIIEELSTTHALLRFVSIEQIRDDKQH